MGGAVIRRPAHPGHVVLQLYGELDVTWAQGAEAAVRQAAAGQRQVIVDLSALDYLDCAALRGLLRARATARREGGDVLLAGPCRPPVRRLLGLTGTDLAPGVYSSVIAARQALAALKVPAPALNRVPQPASCRA